MFAATLRDYTLNLGLGHENAFPDVNGAQLLCLDESARRKGRNRQAAGYLID
jgi:hypothetical protein